MRPNTISLLILGFLLLGAISCATVQPWERGRLSQAAMRMEPRMGDTFQNHVRPVREAAIGGEGGAGGGCGCN